MRAGVSMITLLVLVAGLAGCEREQPATHVGQAIDRAGTATGQAVGNAASATGRAVDRAGNYIDQKVNPGPNN